MEKPSQGSDRKPSENATKQAPSNPDKNKIYESIRPDRTLFLLPEIYLTLRTQAIHTGKRQSTFDDDF